MERTLPSFRWYRAYRVIMLLLGILLLLVAALSFVAILFFRMAALQESPPVEFVALLDAIRVLTYQCLSMIVLTALLFLATYIAQRKKRRAAVALIYTQNVWLPLSSLLLIPMTTTYFRSFADGIREFAGGAYSEGISVFSVLMNTVVPVSCVISAIVTALVLVPNSIYFYKRRDFIHLEDVSV